MFRAIRGSTVFYPSDAVSCEKAVELAANTKGICFIRTGRPAAPVIYEPTEQFAIGKGKVLNGLICFWKNRKWFDKFLFYVFFRSA